MRPWAPLERLGTPLETCCMVSGGLWKCPGAFGMCGLVTFGRFWKALKQHALEGVGTPLETLGKSRKPQIDAGNQHMRLDIVGKPRGAHGICWKPWKPLAGALENPWDVSGGTWASSDALGRSWNATGHPAFKVSGGAWKSPIRTALEPVGRGWKVLDCPRKPLEGVVGSWKVVGQAWAAIGATVRSRNAPGSLSTLPTESNMPR